MQGVSSTFSGTSVSNYRQLSTAVQVSWDKTTASGIQYFTIGQSQIGGSDIIKSTGGGTIALANQYKYTTIPASGVVSWNVSMKLDQFPYGLVQRQADIVLNNADERLLPASGTALGPYIESGRPVIIQAGFGNETIPMFTGYSDSPVNDYNTRTVTLHCYDAIDYLNSYNSKATAPITNTKADVIIAALLAEAGFATNQYILESSLNPVQAYFDPFGIMIGDIIGRFCEAEGAIFFADEAGIMHFWNRQHFSNNSTPVTSLTYSNMATLQQQNSPIINYVQTESSPLALVSGTQQVFTLDQPYYIQANGGNATNSITNPSFEVSTSGWTGTLQRTSVTSQTGAGSWSASGTRMTYDLSSLLVSEAAGTGYTANVQFGFRAPIGSGGLATISGNAQAGQQIAGTQRLALSGTNQWQQFSMSANHFGLTPSGLNGFTSTTPLSTAVSNFGLVANNGYLYTIGGISPIGTTRFNTYAPLTPAVGSFSLATPLPDLLSSMGVVNTSSGVYAFGGSNGTTTLSGGNYSLFQSNGSLGNWIQTTALPAQRKLGGAAFYNNYVYYVGGVDAAGSIQTSVYYAPVNADNSLGAWNSTTVLPLARDFVPAVAYNGFLYALGGTSTGASAGNQTTVYYAVINSNGTLAGVWNTTTVLPVKLAAHQAVAYQGYMYVMGGVIDTGAYNTVIYYAKINGDGTLGAWNNGGTIPYNEQTAGVAINGQYIYLAGGFNGTSRLTNDYYTNFSSLGVNLTVSGASSFYLDAVSNDTVDPYFDGDTTSNNTYSYAWTGASHNSASNRTANTNYLTVQCALNAETYSIVQPTASGLNASNIAALQSYYSFSSVSGTGGIYGTDLTSNISLVNYSVSGTTAFLTFQNNSTQQAYLTNLVLYGQVARASSNISQYYLDQASINNYRLNPTNNGQIMTISNDYIPTTLAAQGLAQYLVQGFKTPYLKHSTDTFALPQLQFGDCVQLVNGDTGETRLGYVMGITNSLDSNANLQQTLTIQERNLANYFTIGVSSIGSSAQIAP